MTPEQYSVMQRLFKGEAISFQPGGLAFAEVCFHNQDPIDQDLFQSLINSEWVREIEQSGTCVSYGASNLGKVAVLIEAKYFSGSVEDAALNLREHMIAIQMHCISELYESEKHTLHPDDNGSRFAREIQTLICSPKHNPVRQQSEQMPTFILPN